MTDFLISGAICSFLAGFVFRGIWDRTVHRIGIWRSKRRMRKILKELVAVLEKSSEPS
jgi:hypothetical protein